MNKNQLATLTLASAVTLSSIAPLSQAAEGNPFATTRLDTGYQLAQADTKGKEGKCGEAKCGADKKASEKKKDGKCGEAKCGADKKPAADKKADGKCGEAKCGARK